MMGFQNNDQDKIFISGFRLDDRVRKDHILRKISQKIDFDFIYDEVKETYGTNGNVSVPPPVILKLMLLLIIYNVRSERELMLTLPERLDWLWFLGYDLEDDIPTHSVLSKARSRWGVETFQRFFERIVEQCLEGGLIEGGTVFIDASLIEADASNNSVVDRERMKGIFSKGYGELEKRLEEAAEKKTTQVNRKYISRTDPDASVTRHRVGTSKLRYKTHRVVDRRSEVITATKVTSGSVDDGEMLEEMVERAKENTEREVETVVADSRYGSTRNYLYCHDKGIRAHMPSLEGTQRGTGRQKGIFEKEEFCYDADRDVYLCPGGQELRRRNYHKGRGQYEYKASSKTCAGCALSEQCTRSKYGRSVKRHIRQDALDRMRAMAGSREAKRDLRTRQHLSERSFAWSTRYGYKRARWRRLWRMEIQDYLVAAVQNITILANHLDRKPVGSNIQRVQGVKSRFSHWIYVIVAGLCKKVSSETVFAYG